MLRKGGGDELKCSLLIVCWMDFHARLNGAERIVASWDGSSPVDCGIQTYPCGC